MKMCEVTGAGGGALLVPQDESASVFLSYRLSLSALGSLSIRFQDHRARLSKGEVVISPGFALAAVSGDADADGPVAWVYLESPRTVEAKEIRPFLLGMAKAVAALGASPAPRVSNENRVDANRANILRILEENDWNIARASRKLGVTRRTLYMRLAAFGIARKKVPRLAKPLTA